MPFTDPNSSQNPTTGLVAPFGWGDFVNGDLNFLRGAKAGCHLTSSVATGTGTDTVLPWATESFDVNACHDNVTNNSRITVPATWGGLWLVGANVRGASDLFTITIVVNATTRIVAQSSNASGGVVSATSCETIYVMAAADYFEVWMTGGTSRDAGSASHFYAHYLASGN
jgi:hypothetical protein